VVVRLAREPGRRDSRWAQLFEELPESLAVATDAEPDPGDAAPAASSAPSRSQLMARIAELEGEVAALRAELAALKQ
jgi:uncharacterized protein YceH (UPF0502 family)